MLFGLIKRGFAKYNGKEIKVGENARARTQNELADMVSASRSYQTSVQVAESAKQMLLSTLRLGKA